MDAHELHRLGSPLVQKRLGFSGVAPQVVLRQQVRGERIHAPLPVPCELMRQIQELQEIGDALLPTR